MKPATAGGRVEIAGGLQVDITEVPEYSNDTQAAAGGIIVGGHLPQRLCPAHPRQLICKNSNGIINLAFTD